MRDMTNTLQPFLCLNVQHDHGSPAASALLLQTAAARVALVAGD
jgi:hypothetical protein